MSILLGTTTTKTPHISRSLRLSGNCSSISDTIHYNYKNNLNVQCPRLHNLNCILRYIFCKHSPIHPTTPKILCFSVDFHSLTVLSTMNNRIIETKILQRISSLQFNRSSGQTQHMCSNMDCEQHIYIYVQWEEHN